MTYINPVLWVHSCSRCQFATVNTNTTDNCPFCGDSTNDRIAKP